MRHTAAPEVIVYPQPLCQDMCCGRGSKLRRQISAIARSARKPQAGFVWTIRTNKLVRSISAVLHVTGGNILIAIDPKEESDHAQLVVTKRNTRSEVSDSTEILIPLANDGRSNY